MKSDVGSGQGPGHGGHILKATEPRDDLQLEPTADWLFQKDECGAGSELSGGP